MDLTYDIYNHAESPEIFLAKPGKRLLGVLNGVDKSSARIELNLNNTYELTFSVYRIIDGIISSYYDNIEQLYELHIPGYGWFKINEEPEIINDGNTEVKNIRAESYEIELQQYDLYNFKVNTAEKEALEYQATDNAYYDYENDYLFFREQVLLYRDTTELEKVVNNFSGETIEDLEEYARNNTILFCSPRFNFDDATFRNAIITAYPDNSKLLELYDNEVDLLRKRTGKSETPRDFKLSLVSQYPLIGKYADITINNESAFENKEDNVTYTAKEILNMEVQRQKDLSLLTYILEPHGWKVGYVDTYVDLESDFADDRIPITQKIGKFDIDNMDVYSFLTQEVASYYRCMFVFDTERNVVDCFNINNVGFNTNIYLGFHNIQNNITRNSDKQIKTVFFVRGSDDLDIREVNFGDDEIEDISYFLNEKHFSKEFIDKYKDWMFYREYKRKTYMQLAIDYRNQLDITTELLNRVPIDASDVEQYKSFSNDDLEQELANQKAQIAGYEKAYVDKDNNFDIELLKKSRTDYANYIMIKDSVIPNMELEMENRALIPLEKESDFDEDYKLDFDKYGDSYGINELETQLKSINNKISAYVDKGINVKPDEDDEYNKKLYANYLKYVDAKASCERALAKRREEYNAQMDILNAFSNKMREIHDAVQKTNPRFGFTEDDFKLLDHYYVHTDYENENVLVADYYTNEQIIAAQYELYKYAVEELYAESHPQWNWSTTQNNLLLMPEFKDWHGVKIGPDNAELWREYWHKTERETADDDGYYKVWRYTQLWIGNFVRVGLREDDNNRSDTVLLSHKNIQQAFGEDDPDYYAYLATIANKRTQAYQAKLRIVKIGLNPFLVEDTIDIEFSNMVQYKSRRNDIVDLFGYVNSSQKNAIKSAIKSAKDDNTFNVDSNLVLKLVSNGMFASYVGNMASTSTNPSDVLSIVTGGLTNGSFGNALSTVIGNQISASSINVGQIVGDKASFNELFSTYIDSDFITTKVLEADEARIDELTTKLITSDDIVTKLLSADEAKIKDLTAEIIRVGEDGLTELTKDTIKTVNISADQINVTDAFVRDTLRVGEDGITKLTNDSITTDTIIARLVEADEGKFDTLTAETGFIKYLNSGVIDAGTVTADTIIAGLANVTEEQKEKFDLLAGSAFIDYLESNLITASEIKVDDLKAKLATIDVADIDTLYADNAFTKSLQALSSSTATSVLNDAYIYNAVGGKITVGDLAAGDITVSDQMRILSDNGKMVMDGNALQIMGTDSQGNDYVGVQLGYATNGQPSLVLRNEDGAVIVDPTGITTDAIADGLIINNMIHDGTIQKDKLGFDIIEPNDQGGVDITQVYDGSGNLWGVQYTSFKQGTEQALTDLNDGIDDINSKKMYRIVIESNNGNIFKNGDINCILSCKVYSWDDDVTDTINAANFTWTRKSKNTSEDAQWNMNHSGGSKTLTITPSDVFGRSVFYCTVTLPDGSTSTGS